MLAYAANRPQFAERPPSPRTLLLIIAVHIAAVVVLLSMKTDLPQAITRQPIIVRLLRDKPPPPQHLVKPSTPRQQPEVTRTEAQVPTPPLQVRGSRFQSEASGHPRSDWTQHPAESECRAGAGPSAGADDRSAPDAAVRA